SVTSVGRIGNSNLGRAGPRRCREDERLPTGRGVGAPEAIGFRRERARAPLLGPKIELFGPTWGPPDDAYSVRSCYRQAVNSAVEICQIRSELAQVPGRSPRRHFNDVRRSLLCPSREAVPRPHDYRQSDRRRDGDCGPPLKEPVPATNLRVPGRPSRIEYLCDRPRVGRAIEWYVGQA